MRKVVLLTVFICAAVGAEPRRVVGLDQVPPGSKCEASVVLNAFIGQTASTELAARMMSAARAPKLRWVAAGGAMTMDHSASRLTVQLDAQNRVVSMRCG